MPAKAKAYAFPQFLTALSLLISLTALTPVFAKPIGRHPASAAHPQRYIMAHYMPWFGTKAISGQWGWHWTMNHYNPNTVVNGQRQIASHYYPLIGPYDSDDPDTLRCQVMLMKLAGINGVMIDWYGNDNYMDYGTNNRNTEALIPILKQAGMKFAIVYEDSTVPKEIAGGVFPASGAVTHGQKLMQWMQQHFFSSPAYLKFDNRPVLLSFGTPYYNNSQWEQIFSVLPKKPMYFTESFRQEPTASVGAFAWPNPRGGTTGGLQDLDAFYQRAPAWPMFIPAAFPRFHDIYQQAGVGPSYGRINGQNGKTYTDTLTRALQSKAQIVQLVTWNDWGEGTEIEPSVEDGYRYLETTQALRKRFVDPQFHDTAQDLRLPVKWYLLRKRYSKNRAVLAKLTAFFPDVVDGHLKQAQALLAHYK